MNPRDIVLETVKRAYQLEVDGCTFYSMAAEATGKPAVRDPFLRLANDEVQHQAFLRDVLRFYDETGAAAFPFLRRAPDMGAFSDESFTSRFREQAAGAAVETAVLSVGIALEQDAAEFFGEAARRATDPEVCRFYGFLADWERRHLEALRTLYGPVRADCWAPHQAPPR